MEASLARSTATMTATPRATAAAVSRARKGSVARGRTIRRYSATVRGGTVSMAALTGEIAPAGARGPRGKRGATPARVAGSVDEAVAS